MSSKLRNSSRCVGDQLFIVSRYANCLQEQRLRRSQYPRPNGTFSILLSYTHCPLSYAKETKNLRHATRVCQTLDMGNARVLGKAASEGFTFPVCEELAKIQDGVASHSLRQEGQFPHWQPDNLFRILMRPFPWFDGSCKTVCAHDARHGQLRLIRPYRSL